MNYNISFTIASIAISLILILIVSLNYSSSNLVNKRFKWFLISTIVMDVLNIGTVYSNYYADKIPGWVNYILNGLYFFSGAVVALLFFYYCVSVAFVKEKAKTRKIYYIVNMSLLGAYAIGLFVNGFTGIFFDFNGGQYNHGPLYYFVNLLAIAYVIESIVIFVLKRKMFNRRQMVSMIIFYAVFFASFGLQLAVFPDVLLSDFGTAIGSLVVFFSLETPDYVKLMATLNELNELKASLEIQVINRTKELDEEKQSYEELTLETLSSLAELIDAKDHYTNGHSFRVAAYAKALAEHLGFSFSESEQIYFAGLIHDVGKIGINESIITKKGRLNDEEYKIIQSHSSLGGNILKGIKEFKIFEEVARSHHERYDGAGYPDKLKGSEIPYAARIVAVCDTFDAMTSDRSYRRALTDEVALAELIRVKDSQLDGHIVDAFLSLYKTYPDSIRNHVDEIADTIGKQDQEPHIDEIYA